MIRWSATTEFVFHLGVLGQAAYLADPSKKVMGLWLFLGLIMLHFLLLLFLALMTPGAFVSLHLVRSHLSDPPPPRLPAS
jgi:hypothetical protein